ncbi:MAG: hypothetical protein ACYCQK_02115 [Acidiferrobacteraceae bacterium]
MSAFTDGCRTASLAAWAAAGNWPQRYGMWKRAPGIGGRAQRGCLGTMLFGVGYFLLPLMIYLLVEMVIVAWALLASAGWALGGAVDAARRGRLPSG